MERGEDEVEGREREERDWGEKIRDHEVNVEGEGRERGCSEVDGWEEVYCVEAPIIWLAGEERCEDGEEWDGEEEVAFEVFERFALAVATWVDIGT